VGADNRETGGGPRLFVATDLAPGADITLGVDQAHYLGAVMRRRAGDPVTLFNGRDGEWAGHLSALARGRGIVTLIRQTRAQAPEPGPWLMFAPVKRDATDLIVRMATELGVAAILPVMTDRTNTARVNLDRLAAIATEAAEQSERLTLPVIVPAARLSDALAAWPQDRRLFAALERADAGPLTESPEPAGLLVGPEGGFSAAERDALSRSPMVTPVSLGPRILRADTACVAGLALLQRPCRARGTLLLHGSTNG
jgi:16S rRNA (uracil1498-N3)-methyltransferase